MSRVNEITAGEFQSEVFVADGPVVVDLYADWCGPCRALAPLLDRLADAYAGRVKFVKVNVDDEPEVARHFDVASIPTLLVFDRGRLVQRLTGLPDPQGFVALLDQLAGSRVPA
ncbi:MAG: thioredoxin [Gemmataceae bacterium]